MKPQGCLSWLVGVGLGVGLLFAMGGCANILVPRHKVLVDAISAPGVTKPSGVSYRLVAKKSVVNNVPVEVPVVKACIDAALTSAGMFEAPPNVPSDLFIEVSYGQETAPTVDPAARETYLQLSARSNPGRSMDRATGPELWDVRVAVLGLKGRIESAMPLLCSVAASYVGTNTQAETKIDVPHNSPEVATVRTTAIKALEALPPPPGAPPAGSPPGAAKSAASTPAGGGAPK